jgi:hypothetical protein
MEQFFLSFNRFALPAMALLLAAICAAWLLRQKSEPPPEAWLLNEINHDRLPLARWENSVGRHPRCDVLLNYATVSRFHAVIARRSGGWVVADTGSRTGTMVNGSPAEKQTAVRHGDSLMFGTCAFRFCDREEERRLAEEEAERFRRQQEDAY